MKPRLQASTKTATVLAVVEALVAELHAGRRSVTSEAVLDRDLGIDSLARLELHRRLERSCGVHLPETALIAAETVADVTCAVAGAGPDEAADAADARPRRRETAAGEEPGSAMPSSGAPERASTLLEALDWHVGHHAERRMATFLDASGEAHLTYGELFRRARAVAAGLRARGLAPGRGVALMLPSGLDYFAAFCGALMAGAVPVPLYPPFRRRQLEDHLRRQAGILRTARAEVLVGFGEILPLARLIRAQVPSLRRVVTVAGLENEARGLDPGAGLPQVGPQDVAFVQFTSGSTGDPKGVVLTHANLLANLRVMGRTFRVGERDRMVSWLPLYHDMGLIGAFLGTLYFGMPLVLMSPLAFLSRPARWLWTLDRHGGTVSAAPNFAYELCLTKIDDDELEGLDLSAWRLALNGSEAVSPATVERFIERFAPYGFRPEAVLPVYGLAENSLGLAFPELGRPPRIDRVERRAFERQGRAVPVAESPPSAGSSHQRFVSCGFPLAGHELRVVDADGRALGERRVGRIEFRGPSATRGYLHHPEATRRLIRDGWLDSGDLGYLADGEVFVTGRVKDVIVRAGRNLHPQELEEAVGSLPNARRGCAAVFGVHDEKAGTERLVVVVETRAGGETAREGLRRAVDQLTVDHLDEPPDEVVIAPPGTVLKTSSGKIRRAATRRLYESGHLGRRRAAWWWQIARLAATGTLPAARRLIRCGGEFGFAAWAWTLYGLTLPPLLATVLTLPRLAWRRRLARRTARFLAAGIGSRIRAAGLEHLEKLEGPAVVVANHQSYLDGMVLTAVLPPRFAYVVKREIAPFARRGLGRLGAVFVERFDHGRAARDGELAATELAAGQSLIFFPEGRLSPAPGIDAFRLGAFIAAARAAVPVVPLALSGTRTMLGGGEWLPRRGSPRITACRPLRPAGRDFKAAVTLMREARAAIVAASGEPDLAAARVSASAPTPRSSPSRNPLRRDPEPR